MENDEEEEEEEEEEDDDNDDDNDVDNHDDGDDYANFNLLSFLDFPRILEGSYGNHVVVAWTYGLDITQARH